MRSRLSLVQQIVSILVLILLIVFLTGYSMMFNIVYANLDHIYDQTQELLSATIRSTEADIGNVQDVLYNIIVSDTVQSAGSDYLRYLEDGNRHASRASMDMISNHVQQMIRPIALINCANILGNDGSVRVIASSGYYRLNESMARKVDLAARAANGSPVCLPCEEPDAFILARALREKEELSMRPLR